MMVILAHSWQGWLASAAVVGGAVFLGLIAHAVLYAILRNLAQRTGSRLDDVFVRRTSGPVRLMLPLLLVLAALPALPVQVNVGNLLRHGALLVFIAACAWLGVRLLDVFEAAIMGKYRTDVMDNLRARKIQTQAHVLRRIAVGAIVLLAASTMLMTFPSIRQIVLSLFASAGLAGLVVAMAARPALSNWIAGLQIALTEPIRIDDVVIVEGEWGWIEEITTTYVVVRIWDLRRLVVPLSYFIEKPRQNWTRRTADLIGSVFLYADYMVPVEEIRQELQRILKSSPLWDGKVSNLQVTDATEHTLQLRALMSASDSSRAWDLRCYVREKLVEFLQRRYPKSLPRARAEVQMQPSA
jgi:small-conductance mechanosensitive channel